MLSPPEVRLAPDVFRLPDWAPDRRKAHAKAQVTKAERGRVRAFAGNLVRFFEEELMFSITSWVRSFIPCSVEWRGLEKRAARGRKARNSRLSWLKCTTSWTQVSRRFLVSDWYAGKYGKKNRGNGVLRDCDRPNSTPFLDSGQARNSSSRCGRLC